MSVAMATHVNQTSLGLGAVTLASLPAEGVAVELRLTPAPRVLWVNPRAKLLDPAWFHCGSDSSAYAENLLRKCAFVTADSSSASTEVAAQATRAFADRYGGSGVGHNGGSGRTVTINGYLVKGVGRTPLVSRSTDLAHASGGAYLEEAVREAIFAEVFSAEFPHSAVPVLAIVETGLVQRWNTENGPKDERRVLIVRPCMLRGAHFERALGFDSGLPQEGKRDARRVQAVFQHCVAALGQIALEQSIADFGVRLARQVAYGFAHRIAHSSPNSSNTALDGRLLDFGAACALPSWADVATMLARRPFQRQFDVVAQAVHSVGYYAGKYLSASIRPATWIANARTAFKAGITAEVLRVLGVPLALAEEVRTRADLGGAWPPVARLLAHFQQEHLDYVDNEPAPALPWDVIKVWDSSPPWHLQPMQQWLFAAMPPAYRDQAEVVCRLRSQTREGLFRQALKRRIYQALDAPDQQANSSAITAFIQQEVAANRRDFTFEPPEFTHAHYEWGEQGGAWVFSGKSKSQTQRVYEWQAPTR